MISCGEPSLFGTMNSIVDMTVACDGQAKKIRYSNWSGSREVKQASVKDTLVADMTGDRIPELQIDFLVGVDDQDCLAASAIFNGARPQEVVAMRGSDETLEVFFKQAFLQVAKVRQVTGPGTRPELALAEVEEVTVFGYDAKGAAKELRRSKEPQTILYRGTDGLVRRFILGAIPKEDITKLTLPGIDFSPKSPNPTVYSPREAERFTARGFLKPKYAPKVLA